jgi:hypothetical protein
MGSREVVEFQLMKSDSVSTYHVGVACSRMVMPHRQATGEIRQPVKLTERPSFLITRWISWRRPLINRGVAVDWLDRKIKGGPACRREEGSLARGQVGVSEDGKTPIARPRDG